MANTWVDAQGSTATFAGFELDGFTRFQATPATGSRSDVTSLNARVVGTGNASRVFRSYHPGAIDPGSASVEVIGTPVYVPDDTGMVGDLLISGPWGSVSGVATLTKVSVSGSVGELARSTMDFEFL